MELAILVGVILIGLNLVGVANEQKRHHRSVEVLLAEIRDKLPTPE